MFSLLCTTVVVSHSVVLLIILLLIASLTAGDIMLRYIRRRLYCVLLWSVTKPSYITEVVFLADMSEYPIEDLFVFVRIVIEIVIGCTVSGYEKFGRC